MISRLWNLLWPSKTSTKLINLYKIFSMLLELILSIQLLLLGVFYFFIYIFYRDFIFFGAAVFIYFLTSIIRRRFGYQVVEGLEYGIVRFTYSMVLSSTLGSIFSTFFLTNLRSSMHGIPEAMKVSGSSFLLFIFSVWIIYELLSFVFKRPVNIFLILIPLLAFQGGIIEMLNRFLSEHYGFTELLYGSPAIYCVAVLTGYTKSRILAKDF